MPQPLVYVLVLNWNRKDETLACLSSLQKLDYPNHRLLVVDNGSEDGSPEAIRARYPKAELLANPENLGYAGGNNVGFRHALSKGADYVFVLNNDTVVAPDALSKLVAFAESRPRAAAVGPKIYYLDRPRVLWSTGSRLFLAKSWLRGRGEEDRGQYDRPWLAPQVVGAAMLVPARALREVGLLDEGYFAYYEETKWCTLARKAGWEVWYAPESKVWHKVAASTGGGTSPTSAYYLVRNRFHFIGDAAPLLEKAPAYLLWAAEVLARSALYLARGRADLLRASWQGALHALLGKRGKRELVR